MNGFGRLFRLSILGESHGPCVGVLLDGVPAGLPLAPPAFEADMARRRGGGAPGTTPRREDDTALLQTGVHEGRTTGAPLLILFENRNTDSSAYAALRHTPRPGHADWVAMRKFGGFNDLRGSGHFSGRLTAGLVAAGVVAKQLLAPVRVEARLTEAGGKADVERAVAEAMAAGDSVGGLVECRVQGLPAGLGEPFFDSVESLLAHAAFAIPAVKGIEFGDGFQVARLRGSQVNDPIADMAGRTATNHAGGINGGITNGNELVFRVAVKPTSSIKAPQTTLDLRTQAPAELKVGGRHDACIALRVPVVLEAVTAAVLADLMLQEGRIPRIWPA
ncbi:chorismate synthase [Mesoterricola sediminis]|uniref:Chorismate synthase n=1 Tax=Mesoterricola sediminis TaxID=2927980 RepID=A0AA48KCK6_9BACT|nr:chorismate synthase [Mesoterricola sediminis]BDU77181.1 chorismate synthase [Mesoterricola sediminis]